MRVAVPTEVMNHEYRVAITPAGVHELVALGHEIIVQAGAGLGSAITDEEYRAAGARIEPTAEATWASGELVLKVKEPVGDESNYLHDGLVLFTYLHLAADRPLTEQLLASGTTALGYETVQLQSGTLPLLYPMSEVAGCLAPQLGAYSLMKPHGGRGLLLGGIAGVRNPRVVVLGAGVAGQNAINVALGMGADVTVLDNDLEKLRLVFWRYENRVQSVASNTLTIREEVAGADMVIGAVLVPGSRTPKLVTNEMVAQMKPGSVLVDIAIDQGGCFEDSHPTTHDNPTFTVHNSLFYCVTNMPGAVPNTSTWALTNATLPYVARVAGEGWRQACRNHAPLAVGLNIWNGHVIHQGVSQAFPDLPTAGLDQALA